MHNVLKPKHYTFGEIETIDYIRDKLTKEEFVGYCIGNVMKYTSRYLITESIRIMLKEQRLRH